MNPALLVRLGLFGSACLGATFILGCCRRFPLGFSATLLIGAYTAACLKIQSGMPWWICIAFGSLAGSLVALIPASLDRFLEGDEYVVFSWVFAMGLAEVIGQLEITGGRHSLTDIPPLRTTGGSLMPYGILALTLFFLLLSLSVLFRRSIAFQEAALSGANPNALALAGRDPHQTSLVVHLFCGAIGGMAGAFWGPAYRTLYPSQFGLSESIVILLVCLLGGQGEPLGVVIGLAAVFLIPPLLPFEALSGILASFSQRLGAIPPDQAVVVNSLNQAFLGVLLIGTIIGLRKGVIGAIADRSRSARKK